MCAGLWHGCEVSFSPAARCGCVCEFQYKSVSLKVSNEGSFIWKSLEGDWQLTITLRAAVTLRTSSKWTMNAKLSHIEVLLLRCYKESSFH